MLSKMDKHDGTVTVFETTTHGNYALVRYYAMTHGILSKLVVLPHEDNDEFERIRDALIVEHQPSGPTEMHLVEDLAAVKWRKRRVLLAENARINDGLKHAVDSSHSTQSAVPFVRGKPDKPMDWQDLMQATPEEIKQSQREMEEYWNQLMEVWEILRKGVTGPMPTL